MSRESDLLFDGLAGHYEEHFAVPHRRAYDRLAWELTLEQLPAAGARIVDVGCGIGRWARDLIGLDHELTGIEPAPAMAAQSARRVPAMRLLADSVETAELDAESFDVALAMGSLQYCEDPTAAFGRICDWLVPGGVFCVLVDSRLALGLELLRSDQVREARARLDLAEGRWVVGSTSAAMHLFDRSSLQIALEKAGFEVTGMHGLLVGATIWGREELSRRLDSTWAAQLQHERALARRDEMTDLGKQLFAVARRPMR